MSTRPIASRLLVAAQFTLIAWLIWPFSPQVWTPAALALAVGATALGVWTLAHNRLGNFNIRPEPRTGARLVTRGPYRFMRHPMYAAVLLFAAAETVAYADAWKIIASLALALVLAAKAVLEERGLREQFPGYADYAKRVRRIIPGLF